jgi:ferredoxin-NADP reductase
LSARIGSSEGVGPRIAVTVQRVPGGEVSSYLVDQFEVGYPIELRGPVGGWFVWAPDGPGATPGVPVLLVAGGSGLVPLMAMVRARRDGGSRDPFRLLYSVRTPADRLYADELEHPRPGDAGLDTAVLYTRGAPLEVAGRGLAARRDPGRITPDDLARFGWPADLEPTCFVCGPTPFVEAVARMLLALGHAPERIRTERFGPTGD